MLTSNLCDLVHDAYTSYMLNASKRLFGSGSEVRQITDNEFTEAIKTDKKDLTAAVSTIGAGSDKLSNQIASNYLASTDVAEGLAAGHSRKMSVLGRHGKVRSLLNRTRAFTFENGMLDRMLKLGYARNGK